MILSVKLRQVIALTPIKNKSFSKGPTYADRFIVLGPKIAGERFIDTQAIRYDIIAHIGNAEDNRSI